MQCLMEWLTFINQYVSTTILAISVLVGIIMGWVKINQVKTGQASNAYQNIMNASYELERVYLKYPSLYLGIRRKKEDADSRKLTKEQKSQLDWVSFMTLDFFDNLLYQKNKGVIKRDSEVWSTWEHFMRMEFRHCPYLCELLKDNPKLYTLELMYLAESSQEEEPVS